MQDRTPLYPGRVKLAPVAGQENTYDMVRADEPTQEGDPLSKATFLKDATAALFGLDATAVPDDAFNVLSRFQKGLGNEYVWEKTVVTNNYGYKESTNELAMSLKSSDGTVTVHYGDTYSVDEELTVTIRNEQTFTMAYGSDPSVMNVLKGKWWWSTQYGNSIVYYLPSDATITRSYVSESCYYYTSVKQTERRDFYVIHVSTTVGYVNSPDQNASPPAVSDGYTYTALGQLGAKVRVETGSYTGTGTYGSSNPNSLTFDFPPKIMGVTGNGSFQLGVSAADNRLSLVEAYTESFQFKSGFGTNVMNYGYGRKTNGGRTIEWYSTNSASNQLNESGSTYYYFAIG